MNWNTQTKKKYLTPLLVVIAVSVAITLLISPAMGAEIIGGNGTQSDTIKQYPSQYNDHGPAEEPLESNNIPPINKTTYKDVSKGKITEFKHLQDKTNSTAQFSASKKGLSVGIEFDNIPSSNTYTVNLQYTIQQGTNVRVTPVTATGSAIKNTYILNSGNSSSSFALSEEESQNVRRTGELQLVISACNVGKNTNFDISHMTLESNDNGDTQTYTEKKAPTQSELSCESFSKKKDESDNGGSSNNSPPETPPVADIYKSPAGGLLASEVVVDVNGKNSTGRGSPIKSYQWELIQIENGSGYFTFEGENPRPHVFHRDEAGKWKLKLTVTNKDGLTGTATKTFEVLKPKINSTKSTKNTTTPCKNGSPKVTNIELNNEGHGDPDDEKYNVIITARDNDNCKDRVTVETVFNPQKPMDSFTEVRSFKSSNEVTFEIPIELAVNETHHWFNFDTFERGPLEIDVYATDKYGKSDYRMYSTPEAKYYQQPERNVGSGAISVSPNKIHPGEEVSVDINTQQISLREVSEGKLKWGDGESFSWRLKGGVEGGIPTHVYNPGEINKSIEYTVQLYTKRLPASVYDKTTWALADTETVTVKPKDTYKAYYWKKINTTYKTKITGDEVTLEGWSKVRTVNRHWEFTGKWVTPETVKLVRESRESASHHGSYEKTIKFNSSQKRVVDTDYKYENNNYHAYNNYISRNRIQTDSANWDTDTWTTRELVSKTCVEWSGTANYGTWCSEYDYDYETVYHSITTQTDTADYTYHFVTEEKKSSGTLLNKIKERETRYKKFVLDGDIKWSKAITSTTTKVTLEKPSPNEADGKITKKKYPCGSGPFPNACSK